MGINVFNRSEKELSRLYLLSKIVHEKYAAIDQYFSGMKSISPSLIIHSAYPIMKSFLEYRQIEITYEKMMSLFYYDDLNRFLPGSTKYALLQDNIVDFELLLSNIEAGEVMLDESTPLRFDHLIEFCTGVDRIPSYGFEKAIEITFHDVSLPSASTCGLTLTLPTTALSEKIIMAIKFGQGFGAI